MNKKRLLSISNSLASQNRDNGPRCKFYNRPEIEGGASSPKSDFGTRVLEIVYNAPPSTLYEMAIMEDNACIADTGALLVNSGMHTGRSPGDKRLVYYEDDPEHIWWEDVSPNIKMTPHTFKINRETTICYLNTKPKIYIFDGFAGWNNDYKLKVRIICTRPYHALFMYNMLIRPTEYELDNFDSPDFTIYNAGSFPCNRFISDMTSSTTVDFDFRRREILILGTQYAGEMKKGIFTVMNYLMPKKGILSLHSSCTTSLDMSNTTLFFGLSGTGKTTLSADPNRLLIGDDEHCWYDGGVFNIEGGCYAKCINLKKESEPDIWEAIKYGSLLENVTMNQLTKKVIFDDGSITQNTRVSYPIEYIKNAKIPCNASQPNNIIFLCCDAFGVIPPISKLTLEQAIYYFISGYTAKIPGTEMGIKEPIPTFSACFGEAFITCHPSVYAQLLRKKIEEHNPSIWLINTGWIKGKYGSSGGKRCPLKYTRKIIDNIHNNSLKGSLLTLPIFGLKYYSKIENIPDEVLDPVIGWDNREEYMSNLIDLSKRFKENFKKYNNTSFINDFALKGGPI